MSQEAAEVTESARRRLVISLCCIGLLIGSVAVCAQLPFSDWRTGCLVFGLNLVLTVALAFRYRDGALLRLLGFGLAMGICELAADAYLVDIAKTLDYSIDGGGPRLWRSPVYMPFAWQIVAVQFTVIGAALQARWGRIGIVLTGLIGGASIPIYDELARTAHWWSWAHCRMLHNTPYYVIAAYALIAMCFACSAPILRRMGNSWSRAVLLGVANGLAALPIVVVTHKLIG